MDIANPKLDMPELLYPNRKPVGNVKIDWEHPLAEGLIFFLVATPAGLVDLVSNQIITAPTAPITTNGLGAHFPFIAKRFYISEEVVTSMTLGCIVKVNANLSNDVKLITLHKDLDNQGFMIRYINDNFGYWSRAASGTSRITSNAPGISSRVANKETFKITIRQSSIGDLICIDGYTYESGSTNQVREFDHVWINTERRVPGQSDISHHCAYAYRKALSAEMILSMNDNPYQFLIPA